MSNTPVRQHDGGPQTRRSSRRMLVGLLLLSALLLCLAYQAPVSVRVDIGEAGDAKFIQGFYFVEHQDSMAFRWSGPAGVVRFHGVGGRPWTLRMRASGLRPAGPALVKVTANGEPVTDQAFGGEMAEYESSIRRPLSGVWGNLDVGLAVETFVAPPDERRLGVMVDWVELSPAGSGATAPPWGMLAALLLVVTLCYLSAERLIRGGLGSARSLRWASLIGLLVAVALSAGLVWARLWIGMNAPWLVLAFGLLLLASWRLSRATWWEWVLFTALAVSSAWFLGRALNFARDGLPPGDFTIYFEAARNLRTGRPLYDFAAATGMPNGPVYKYPPLFAVLLAPATRLPIRVAASWWYWFNLALLGLTGCMLVRILRGLAKPELVAAGAYLSAIGILLFRPVWESMIRGQLDVLILAASVAALWLMRARRTEWLAGILLGFVTLLKLYPGLIALYLLMQRRWRALIGLGVSFSVFVVVSGAIVGWGTLWRYLTEVLAVQTAAVPYPENQSYDGLLSRLVVPVGQTEWYTTVPFSAGARSTLLLLDLVTVAVVILFLWRGIGRDQRRFVLGYAAIMPVIVLLWPTAWIHYETLLLLPLAFLLWDSLRPGPSFLARLAALAVSYLLLAVGNEYLVLTEALNRDGPVRMLQSYKLFGVLLLLGLLLWSRRYDHA